jgi:hypothetical protein
MKKRVFSILAIAALLVASIAIPCVAQDTHDLPASVEVSEYISITITDNGTAGINFGTVNPGTTDNPDINSIAGSGNSTIRITVDAGSNANVDIQISGTDFIATDFTIANAKYSTTIDGTKELMTGSDTLIVGADNLAPGEYIDLWHWLDVPSSIPAGTYGSTFTYKAVAH